MAYSEHPLTDQMQPLVREALAQAQVRPDTSKLASFSTSSSVAYALLKATHADYDLPYWEELRALYKAGKHLLRNPDVMQRLFPKHQGEEPITYRERCRRAYYVAHLAVVIDHIVAGLASDPLVMRPPGATDDEPEELSEFWAEFSKDCSPEGGTRQSFDALVLDQAKTGLLLGRFATLVDLPRPGEYLSEADQREAGALDPYAVAIPPECLLDWEADDAGELLWINYQRVSCPRESVFAARDRVVEEYRIYTREEWLLFRVEYRKDKKQGEEGGPPKDDEMIPVADSGPHTFGRVPIVLEVLPEGLWAGNKIASMAVEYFNKSCGLSWAEFKTVYSQLYEFLAPALKDIDSVPNEHQEDPERAKKMKRGPGFTQVRGNEDDAKYVGPDTTGFAIVAERLADLRQDIYRVTYQMALAEDNTGGLVKRSAESKNVDHEVTDVLLTALATKILRPHAERVVDAGAAARGEEDGYQAAGMDDFAEVDVGALVERAVNIELMQIPSATYQKKRKLRLAKADLERDATPGVISAIEQELEAAITQDQFDAQRDADLGDEEARAGEAAARGEEAARVERGEIPVLAKKPPKPGEKKGRGKK